MAFCLAPLVGTVRGATTFAMQTELGKRAQKGSECEANYDAINLNIAMSPTFSERSRSGPSKGQGHPRGTPTMFFEIIGFEAGGGVRRVTL